MGNLAYDSRNSVPGHWFSLPLYLYYFIRCRSADVRFMLHRIVRLFGKSYLSAVVLLLFGRILRMSHEAI